MDFVSAGKNTLLLYVTVCEKAVPRLNKHDDVIERNFMKILPLEMKSWLGPWWRMYPFNLPLSAPACYWVPFRLSKHRLSHTLSQHQSNS